MLSDDEPLLPGRPDVRSTLRSSLFEELFSLISVRSSVPAGLGLGHSAVQDKASALLFSWWLECGWDGLPRMLSSFVSFTSDMGTECAVPSLTAFGVPDLMPPWLRSEDLVSDVHECKDGHSLTTGSVTAPRFLPTALSVPGILHVCSNAGHDIHGALVGWEAFHAKLKTFEKFLCHKPRVDRFLAKCTNYAGPGAKWVRPLERRMAPLYDKRWSEVFHFCSRLSEVIPVLSQAWHEGLFAEHLLGPAELDDFRATDLTPLLQDCAFKAYMDMILEINLVLESLSAWAEQCPCHTELQEQYRGATPIGVLREECGALADHLDDLACPLRSCRAPELAAGSLPQHLDTVCDNSFSRFIGKWGGIVSPEKFGPILIDFNKAKAHLHYILSLKLGHLWSELPWKLAVLGHHNPTVARRGANDIIEMIMRSPQHDHLHHPLTLKICSSGTLLRRQLESFASGRCAEQSHPSPLILSWAI